jgi:hypothetical protein
MPMLWTMAQKLQPTSMRLWQPLTGPQRITDLPKYLDNSPSAGKATHIKKLFKYPHVDVTLFVMTFSCRFPISGE